MSIFPNNNENGVHCFCGNIAVSNRLVLDDLSFTVMSVDHVPKEYFHGSPMLIELRILHL